LSVLQGAKLNEAEALLIPEYGVSITSAEIFSALA
jgi:hypothetical protein